MAATTSTFAPNVSLLSADRLLKPWSSAASLSQSKPATVPLCQRQSAAAHDQSDVIAITLDRGPATHGSHVQVLGWAKVQMHALCFARHLSIHLVRSHVVCASSQTPRKRDALDLRGCADRIRLESLPPRDEWPVHAFILMLIPHPAQRKSSHVPATRAACPCRAVGGLYPKAAGGISI